MAQEAVITITPQQLQDILQAQARTLVEELRKPDPETAAKQEAERKRLREAREHAVQVAIAEEQSKKAKQDACGHVKENGKSTVSGQKHSDGLVHPVCLRCQKEFTPYRPADSAGGID